MGGIAGALSRRPQAEVERSVECMLRASAHRGPGGSTRKTLMSSAESGCLTLGHLRLAAHPPPNDAVQPVCDRQTRSWLVCNAELYNGPDVQAELRSHGYACQSTNTPETLLYALVAWRERAIDRLEGMFAFAFWDGRREALLLGRDVLGAKPLLLSNVDDAVFFASEFRAMRAAVDGRLTLDQQALASYLVYGAVVEPATMAREVVLIPPGHIVTVEPNLRVAPPRRVRDVRDLQVADGATHRPVNLSRATVETEHILTRAVGARLKDAAPQGVLLSGGVDSSLLACLAGPATSGRRLQLLTMVFPGPYSSDTARAVSIARRLDAEHRMIEITPADVATGVTAALDAMDQPTIDGVNTFLVCRAAAALDIRTLLSGLGGDEVFGGYTTFQKAVALARGGRWLSRTGVLLPPGLGLSAVQRTKLRQARAVHSLREAYLLQRSLRWQGAACGLSAAAGLPPEDFAVPPEAWRELADDVGMDAFHNIARMETVFYLRNQLLRDADVFGSANAVALRAPYLDLGLITHAWCFRGGQHVSLLSGRKRILKHILARKRPDLSIPSKKSGFVLPWDEWLRGPLQTEVNDTLRTKRLYDGMPIDFADGVRTLESFTRRDTDVSWIHIWSMFTLLRWQYQHKLTA